MLDPIREKNNDINDKILYTVILESFNSNNGLNIDTIVNVNNVIDYIPTYEINIKSDQVYNIPVIISINVTILICYIVYIFEKMILLSYSCYIHEKLSLYISVLRNIIIVILSVLLTHYV